MGCDAERVFLRDVFLRACRDCLAGFVAVCLRLHLGCDCTVSPLLVIGWTGSGCAAPAEGSNRWTQSLLLSESTKQISQIGWVTSTAGTSLIAA